MTDLSIEIGFSTHSPRLLRQIRAFGMNPCVLCEQHVEADNDFDLYTLLKRYVSGLLRAHPSLEALIDHETAEAIWLANGICIEIHTCSFRSLGGYTCVGAVVDEVAFWDREDTANPDKEVLVAIRAAMASVPEAMLIGLSSVYARRGEVWRVFDKYFGSNDSADILVINAPTRTMNPTIDEKVIATAYEDDPIAAAAEYGAEFRRDVEVFLPLEALDAVRIPNRFEQPYPTTGRAQYSKRIL